MGADAEWSRRGLVLYKNEVVKKAVKAIAGISVLTLER